jgi:hypothetical protein
MVDLRIARRDAALLAVLQARTRLENASRIVEARVEGSSQARRMAAILDVLTPVVAALEAILGDE